MCRLTYDDSEAETSMIRITSYTGTHSTHSDRKAWEFSNIDLPGPQEETGPRWWVEVPKFQDWWQIPV